MNNQFFPLTVHNNTNGQISCRYMRNGGGNNVVKVGPRGQTVIADAFLGMSVYACNEYDPSQAYAYVNVNQNVDDVFFSESSGGFGRGAPVGPPDASRDGGGSDSDSRSRDRVLALNKQINAQQAAAAASAAAIPVGGDSADQHGTSLAAAYGPSAVAGEGSKEGGGGDRVFVPNMGYMERSSIPAHVLAALEQRQQQQQQPQQQQRNQRQPFMPYDQQAIAASLDGMKPLPPLALVARPKPSYFGELTAPERWVADTLSNYGGVTRARADHFARPLALLVVAVIVFLYMRSRAKQQQHLLPMRRRRW